MYQWLKTWFNPWFWYYFAVLEISRTCKNKNIIHFQWENNYLNYIHKKKLICTRELSPTSLMFNYSICTLYIPSFNIGDLYVSYFPFGRLIHHSLTERRIWPHLDSWTSRALCTPWDRDSAPISSKPTQDPTWWWSIPCTKCLYTLKRWGDTEWGVFFLTSRNSVTVSNMIC